MLSVVFIGPAFTSRFMLAISNSCTGQFRLESVLYPRDLLSVLLEPHRVYQLAEWRLHESCLTGLIELALALL
jgi:hypothetical protein